MKLKELIAVLQEYDLEKEFLVIDNDLWIFVDKGSISTGDILKLGNTYES